MSYPNSAPISGTEKGWGVVIALLSFPLGLFVLLGLLADQGWGRWAGLVLGGLLGLTGIGVAIWLVVLFLPSQGASYPFGPWFVFLAGLIAILGLLAARSFLVGLRSEETD